MANLPPLLLRINADAAGALRGLGSVVAQLAAATAAAVSFGAALKKGFAANSESENILVGLKGIIASLQDVRDASGAPAKGMERLAISGAEAERQLKLLRVAGMQTSAEFKDLAKAFQTALGAGSSAGLSVDKIRELTVSLTLAASSFNLSGDQLSSEIRAMLSGDQIDNSEIAHGLGIFSGAQIKKWREAGTLFDELNKRLELFKLNGAEAGKTWSATLSNLGDGITLFLGQTTKGAFDGVKNALQGVFTGSIDENGDIKKEFAGIAEFAERVFTSVGVVLADGINGAIEAVKELSAWFDQNYQTIEEIFGALGRIGQVLGIAVGAVADLAGETTKVSDGTKLVRDALNGVALVAAVVVDTLRGMVGVVGFVGGAIASALLDPLLGVARVLSMITGKDYTAGLEKVKTATEGFKSAAKGYALDAFNFDTVKKVKAQIEAEYRASPIKALDPAAKKPGATGSVKAPPKKTDDDKAKDKSKKDAERAAKAYAEALKSYEDAKRDADTKIAKVVKDAALRDLEASLAARQITQEKYLTKKAALDEEENALALKAARRQQASLAAAEAAEKDPAKKKKLEGNLEKIRADIAELEGKGADIPARLKLDLAAFKETVESLRIDIKADILDANGLPYEAALERLAKKTQDLLNDPRVRGDAGLTADVARSAEQQKDVLALTEAKRLMDDKAAYFTLAEQRIARDVEMGRMTQTAAEQAIQAERQKTVAGIEAYIAVLERLAAAYPDNASFALTLSQAREQLALVSDEANKTGVALHQAFAQGVTGALKEMLTTAKSATDVIKGLFFKLIDAIAAKALEKLTAQLFANMAGGGGGGGSTLGTVVTGIGKFLGFAEGGYVRGPGTSTSDSIPAFLSDKEYVFKASAVRKWGVGFLNALNAGYMPRSMPRFADGGLVGLAGAAGGGGGAAPQVNVQNHNQANLYLDPNHLASTLGRHPQMERDIVRIVIANKSKFGF
jgi:hypothetical protein